MKAILDFAILCHGLTLKDKIKLVLFALGLKPAASLYLHITPQNLDEAYAFEHVLRMCKIIYLRGREKSFEEVKKIHHNKVLWDLAGLWVDYDLFHTIRQKEQFLKYKTLWQYGKEPKKRNVIAGELYGYPACCIVHYNKETLKNIRTKYSYYDYFKKIHALDKKFSLLPYAPCSLSCKKSIENQKNFAKAISKASPSFWHHLQEVHVYETDVVIESENEVSWPKKNGHDYIILAMTPLHDKFWFYSVLTKKAYPNGIVLSATIKHYATHGEVILGKEKGVIENLYHERYLPLLKREY